MQIGRALLSIFLAYFVGRDLKWTTEPDEFDIKIGDKKKRLVYVTQ